MFDFTTVATEHLALGLIRIGHEPAFENMRQAGNISEQGRKQSAGAAFCGGKPKFLPFRTVQDFFGEDLHILRQYWIDRFGHKPGHMLGTRTSGAEAIIIRNVGVRAVQELFGINL